MWFVLWGVRCGCGREVLWLLDVVDVTEAHSELLLLMPGGMFGGYPGGIP